MIDLHAHTNLSDGTCTPGQLIEKALANGLEALAICDHDTFDGYDQAAPLAASAGLELVCGIELSTHMEVLANSRHRSVHLLGYFLDRKPTEEFRNWLREIQENRHKRNRALVSRLQSLGIDITLEEVRAIGGNLAGRPHFATILVQKAYVDSIQDAFTVYLADSAKAYVEREEPSLTEGIREIRRAGGLTSLAHPVRFGNNNIQQVERVVARSRDERLDAIEVYHSDHSTKDVEAYLLLCRRYGLGVTGGSDFHGGTKPGIELGSGKNRNLSIPRTLLEQMRTLEKLRNDLPRWHPERR